MQRRSAGVFEASSGRMYLRITIGWCSHSKRPHVLVITVSAFHAPVDVSKRI
jgi:hypothetical protein